MFDTIAWFLRCHVLKLTDLIFKSLVQVIFLFNIAYVALNAIEILYYQGCDCQLQIIAEKENTTKEIVERMKHKYAKFLFVTK
jgi:hypothetical protein